MNGEVTFDTAGLEKRLAILERLLSPVRVPACGPRTPSGLTVQRWEVPTTDRTRPVVHHEIAGAIAFEPATLARLGNTRYSEYNPDEYHQREITARAFALSFVCLRLMRAASVSESMRPEQRRELAGVAGEILEAFEKGTGK